MNLKLLFLVFAAILFSSNSIQAQVIEDGTLSTEVTQTGDRLKVTGGEQRGNNLFHSFVEFSLANEGSVLFDNALAIENIISRVTGNSVSDLNGLIQSNGTANLFLINPNGIIFGENAALNIGGSFVATTAETLLFEDGAEFSANLDNSESLLTISTPLGLQFGTSAGAINNQANFSVANPLDPTGESQSKLGLVTADDRTLALIGNGITFDGGAITVPSGNIELGSVAENSSVSLKPFSEGWKVNYDNVSQFRDIKLDNLASVDASGEGGGSIQITGRNIELLDGSAIASNTLGNLDGKSININASNLLKIDGSDTTGTVDLLLAGFEIFLPSASQISSNTSGGGNSGDINFTAKNLQLSNGGAIELQTLPTGTGNGGNLAIAVDESIILKGSRPLLGVGENAANSIISTISLDAAIELNRASQISAVSINSGKAADIEITAQNLRLEDGSLIAASPFASGNGGNINLTLGESLQIIGVSEEKNISSQITANTFGDGDAGSINIVAKQLKIADGSLLLSTTPSTGNSGDININADLVQISGIRESDRIPSSISTQTFGDGDGGNIFLNTNNLIISDRASLSVKGSGSGVPGSLVVNADSVELRSASITAETEFQTGGNIELNIQDRLTLRENSLISAQAFNDADGGNLSIDANFVVAFPQENNDILANALFGKGGNIAIDTIGIFGLEKGSSNPPNLTNNIDASSEFGTAGVVSISFPTISKIEGELKTPSDEVDVESLFKNSFCKVRGKSNFATTGRGGIPRIPNNTILPEHTWSDWRIVETEVSQQEVESVEEKQTAIPKKLTMIQGWVTDSEGNIVLTDRPTVVAASQPGFKTPDCNRVKNEELR